jgi:DNA-binding CsgD family transcriptional regulator
MWARQGISPADVDYGRWERRRAELVRMAGMTRSPIFAVDVLKGVYDYASEGFTDLFGIAPERLCNISEQGDFIEEMIHPDDRARVVDLQIRHAKFIYTLPPEERNDYHTIYQMRMRGAGGGYINIVSRQRVIETDRHGRAWIVMGMMELAPDQTPTDRVRCSVLNIRTGHFFNPYAESREWALTDREREVLSLMAQGLLSKEIASRLEVSKHTVDNHRKNILAKLGVDNTVEAINTARGAGLTD